jgi:hypothetical protein
LRPRATSTQKVLALRNESGSLLVVVPVSVANSPMVCCCSVAETDIRVLLVASVDLPFARVDLDTLGVQLGEARVVCLLQHLRGHILLFHLMSVDSSNVGGSGGKMSVPTCCRCDPHTSIDFPEDFLGNCMTDLAETKLGHVRVVGSLLSSSPFHDDS